MRADTGEHRHATVELGDIVDQFHDDDRLAHSSAAERTDLAALQKWADQIDDFDACLQHLRRRGLVHERRWRAMDGIVLLRLHWPALIHGIAGYIEYPAHHTFSHWHGYRCAAVLNLKAALEAFGTRHRNRSDPPVPEMLLHFERQFGGFVLDFVFDGQGVVDAG